MMRNRYGVFSCCVLLSFVVVLDDAYAKKPQKSGDVSAIYLDVLRVKACAVGKGCSTVGGPKQINLLEMAEGKTDFAKQVLMPAKTNELRLILGKNSTIAVDGQTYPLTVPSGQVSGLKLKGQKVFGKTGGFLTDITLDFDLAKGVLVKTKTVKGKGKKDKDTVVYSYSLKPVVTVLSADIEPLKDGEAAVIAMPGKESTITLGDNFSLFIPVGAISAPMVISAEETKYTVEVMDAATGEMVEKPALASNYELSPDGAEFAVPLKITIPYYTDTLPSDMSEYDLAVYLDGEKLPTDINIMPKTATADVWHFTSATVSYPQATGSFVFPFAERDNAWQICQGYNTPNITHGSSTYPKLIHAFDFAYGLNNLGNTGCWNNPGGSEDKTVIVPAAGMITENTNDITKFKLKVPVSNEHGAQIRCVRLGHMKNSDRKSANPTHELPKGTSIGKLCGPNECASDGGYAHVHMAAYESNDCSGVTVPFGTVFGSGYPDFSSDGSLRQWHGTKIPSDGSQPTTCPNGNGLYCGDSSLGQDVNTLYSCENGNYSVQEQCANGCQMMPAGTDDQCKDVQPTSCPNGNGLYCGKSSLGQDEDTLYYCQDGDYDVHEQCSNGCQEMPAGTNDKCMSEPTSCQYGNGYYCGKSSLGQDEDTLYYCEDGHYDVHEQCSNGCQLMDPGINDKCK